MTFRAKTLVLSLVIAVVALVTQTAAVAEGQRCDEVFASVDATSDIVYGQALDENGQPEVLRSTSTSQPATRTYWSPPLSRDLTSDV